MTRATRIPTYSNTSMSMRISPPAWGWQGVGLILIRKVLLHLGKFLCCHSQAAYLPHQCLPILHEQDLKVSTSKRSHDALPPTTSLSGFGEHSTCGNGITRQYRPNLFHQAWWHRATGIVLGHRSPTSIFSWSSCLCTRSTSFSFSTTSFCFSTTFCFRSASANCLRSAWISSRSILFSPLIAALSVDIARLFCCNLSVSSMALSGHHSSSSSPSSPFRVPTPTLLVSTTARPSLRLNDQRPFASKVLMRSAIRKPNASSHGYGCLSWFCMIVNGWQANQRMNPGAHVETHILRQVWPCLGVSLWGKGRLPRAQLTLFVQKQ